MSFTLDLYSRTPNNGFNEKCTNTHVKKIENKEAK